MSIQLARLLIKESNELLKSYERFERTIGGVRRSHSAAADFRLRIRLYEDYIRLKEMAGETEPIALEGLDLSPSLLTDSEPEELEEEPEEDDPALLADDEVWVLDGWITVDGVRQPSYTLGRRH